MGQQKLLRPAVSAQAGSALMDGPAVSPQVNLIDFALLKRSNLSEIFAPVEHP